MRKSMWCGCVAMLAIGCGSDTVLTEPDRSSHRIPTVVVDRLDPDAWKTDPIDIRSTELSADEMLMHVEYGGGCETHTFAFIVSSDFVERLEAGQGPAVETDALIAHDAHGDLCERLVRDTLVADLKPLREAYKTALQSDSGAIVMIFDDSTAVRYQF